MPEQKVGTREEWSAARKELLEREQELGNLDEELAKQRKELPWVPVEKEYIFDTEEGKRTLAELFEGRSQLLIYHLMFVPTYEAACPGCTGLADHFDAALAHLNNRDVGVPVRVVVRERFQLRLRLFVHPGADGERGAREDGR